MIWKNRNIEIPHIDDKEAQQLAATMDRLLGEANGALDGDNFESAGDAMLQAAIICYRFAGIQAGARLSEILSKEG